MLNVVFPSHFYPSNPREVSMNFEQQITMTKIQAVSDKGLIAYMAGLGVQAHTTKKYLKELTLYNRAAKKHFVALGMLNEEEGYEVRNLHVSDCIGERDISVIRGTQIKPNHLHVFLDMKDFLAVVAREKDQAFKGDALVLHTWDLLHKVPPYLYQYGYKDLHTWMPNNHSGRQARNKLSAFCACEPGLQHRAMNGMYWGYENATEWCVREKPLRA